MKKLILSTLLSLISLFAVAEERGWYLSGIGSIGIEEGAITHSEGIAVGYMLRPHFGVFGGIGMQTEKYSDYSHGPMAPRSESIDVTRHLQLSLFIRLITSKAGRVGFYTDLGVKDCLPISEKKDNDFSDTTPYGDTFLVFVHPGIKVPFGKRVSLNLGPELALGATAGAYIKGSLNVYLR